MTKFPLYLFLLFSSQIFAAQYIRCSLAINSSKEDSWKRDITKQLPVYEFPLLELPTIKIIDGKRIDVVRGSGVFSFIENEFSVSGVVYMSGFVSLKIANTKIDSNTELYLNDTPKVQMVLRGDSKEGFLRCEIEQRKN